MPTAALLPLQLACGSCCARQGRGKGVYVLGINSTSPLYQHFPLERLCALGTQMSAMPIRALEMGA